MDLEIILAGFLATVGAIFGLSQIKTVPKVFSENQIIVNNDIDILARTIWGEARGDGYRGMQAVANVIMNRFTHAQNSIAKARQFGFTIEDICKKPYQFSVWNSNDLNLNKILSVNESNKQFRQALNIAKMAVGGRLRDITNGADHYHTSAVNPKWSRGAKVIANVGTHKFFDLV